MNSGFAKTETVTTVPFSTWVWWKRAYAPNLKLTALKWSEFEVKWVFLLHGKGESLAIEEGLQATLSCELSHLLTLFFNLQLKSLYFYYFLTLLDSVGLTIQNLEEQKKQNNYGKCICSKEYLHSHTHLGNWQICPPSLFFFKILRCGHYISFYCFLYG